MDDSWAVGTIDDRNNTTENFRLFIVLLIPEESEATSEMIVFLWMMGRSHTE
ncbi:hypothetical protein H6F86_22060 [Phormidium sp. FACHB-592]|uniref:Uncharacterized protein n=1 Tax=Stenomitos frigidus AS-A4 TaxID=2933935 RepID=A0ABV0KFA6_9CYAN|nr:hypothetical protein [Phormidium sp. FACHB-592]MBD2076521.1 hypothetical protein [Phormidium sp. FACHB-592]